MGPIGSEQQRPQTLYIFCHIGGDNDYKGKLKW